MYDIIVVGAGPAGMTAALYARRAGKSVLLLEQGNIGGQITFSPRVENFPGIKAVSGIEFSDTLADQVLGLGAVLEVENVQTVQRGENCFTVKTEYGEYQARSLVAATGLQHKKLGLPGEEELVGSGISYCAVCDGAFFKGKVTAVVGGGNTAVQDALYLADLCETVHLIYRRDTFRAEPALVSRLLNATKIRLHKNTVVSALSGEKSLKGLQLRKTDGGTETLLSVDGLFVAVGQAPKNTCFETVLTLDEEGYIPAGEDCVTNVPGIFAAGDCRRKTVRQLTTAVADGAVAGLAACRYLDSLLQSER